MRTICSAPKCYKRMYVLQKNYNNKNVEKKNIFNVKHISRALNKVVKNQTGKGKQQNKKS